MSQLGLGRVGIVLDEGVGPSGLQESAVPRVLQVHWKAHKKDSSRYIILNISYSTYLTSRENTNTTKDLLLTTKTKTNPCLPIGNDR